MILHRSEKEVKRFNWFKWIVLLLLITILIIMLLTGRAFERTAVSDTTPPDTAAQIDATAPELTAPTFNTPADDLTSGEVTLSGTGTPGSDVAVVVDGNVVGTAKVGADGKWSLSTDLDAGSYQLSARTLDADGNVAAEADAISLSVGEALVAPSIDTPSADLTAGTATLTGVGTPGSEVDVLVDGVSVGRTTVGADGTWSLDAELPEGDIALSAEAMSGGETAVSDPISFSINPRFVAPTINLPDGELAAGTVSLTGTGTPGSTVDIVVDGEVVGTTVVGDDGSWAFDLDWPEGGEYELSARTLDADGNVAAEAPPMSFELADMSALSMPSINWPDFSFPAGLFSLTGTGRAGDQVEVVVDGEVVGTTTVGADGTWSFDLDLPGGEYEVATRAYDANGNLLAESDPTSVTVASLDLEVPTFDMPDGGFNAGQFALSGTGTPGTEVEVVVDGEVVGTTMVGDDGTWSFDLDLPEGEYEVATRAYDANGNLLAESDPTAMTVAALDLQVPTIDIPDGGFTAGQFALSGTGTPGTEIEVVVDGEVVGTTTVGNDGIWSFNLNLPEGEYEVAARALDANGQVITSSDSVMTTIEAPVTEASAVGVCDNPAPGVDQGSTYVVGECEWLIRIANRLGIEYDSLIGINPQIENPNIIFPGQIINLPPR